MTEWTAKLVRETLADAVRWAHHTVTSGASGMSGSQFPYKASLEDHLEEGWGLPEIAGDEEEEEKERVFVSAERAQQYEAALQWQAAYLGADHPVSSQLLAAWLRSQIKRRSGAFEAAAKRMGFGKSQAYRLRDRALGVIAMGLTVDGVDFDDEPEP